MTIRIFSLFLILAFGQLALAAVPVEDIQQRGSEQHSAQQQGSGSAEAESSSATAVAVPDLEALPEPTPPVATDSYSQLQMLREEVMQLRGLVEQLSFEVQQLKQRQMDDYMDLDRRLSSAAAANGPTPPVPTAAPTNGGSESGSSDEVQSYSDAYNLLKEGKIDNAVMAFKQHINDYPAGNYTANCHYWLGEVYLLKRNLEQARQSFTIVVEDHPDHRKVTDATFKLGTVYHSLGNNDKAKSLLEKAAAGDSSAARKAKQYLTDNF